MLGHYEVLICGLSGEVSLNSYSEKVENKELISFKLNLDPKEMISFVKKDQDDKLVVFVTSKFGNFYRLLVYKYLGGMLEYVTEWRRNDF